MSGVYVDDNDIDDLFRMWKKCWIFIKSSLFFFCTIIDQLNQLSQNYCIYFVVVCVKTASSAMQRRNVM